MLWKEAGYFDTASELKPLLHLWSLAIEEQFYLVYPLMIWGAWRIGLNVFIMVILLGLLSFGLNISGIKEDAVRTFFLPHTRFWELLAGAVLAYLELFKRMWLDRWLKEWNFQPFIFWQPPRVVRRNVDLNSLLSVLGLLLIVVAAFGLNKGKLFPGWFALAPVIGAFLLIFTGPEAWVNRNILANRLILMALANFVFCSNCGV
jgi:peptidoglycan/LPS O-acetylase OafA/YrhL